MNGRSAAKLLVFWLTWLDTSDPKESDAGREKVIIVNRFILLDILIEFEQ